jgi:hypothetical protein
VCGTGCFDVEPQFCAPKRIVSIACPCRQSRHGERVWMMTTDAKRVDAELRGHGEHGWECQFLYEGELAYGRRWTMRAAALAEAARSFRTVSRDQFGFKFDRLDFRDVL